MLNTTGVKPGIETVIVSGASEQFATVPLTVTGVPGHCAASGLTTSVTHGTALHVIEAGAVAGRPSPGADEPPRRARGRRKAAAVASASQAPAEPLPLPPLRPTETVYGALPYDHPSSIAPVEPEEPDNSERINLGAEYAFHNYIFLRGGYNVNYDAEGIAGGVGFRFPVSFAGTADFDYAFTDMKALGAAHRFSLKFAF